MKVITHPISTYGLVFIPREYRTFGVVNLEITNERSGFVFLEVLAKAPALQPLGYLSLNTDLTSLNIVEGDSLTIKIFDNEGVIYRGKIYATNQTDLENFQLISVNANVINL